MSCVSVVISGKRKLWLWTAVSRHTGQILAYRLADRTWVNAGYVRNSLPTAWHKRRVYTDHYGPYSAYLARSRHVPSDKGDGKTSVVEQNIGGGGGQQQFASPLLVVGTPKQRAKGYEERGFAGEVCGRGSQPSRPETMAKQANESSRSNAVE